MIESRPPSVLRAPRPSASVLRSPIALPALLLAALFGLSACDRAGNASAPAASAAAPALTVGIIEAKPGKVPRVLDAVGRVEGSREVEIRARVTGILEKQLYREGEPVCAGAPLYRIDRAPFEIALAQARAALEQERARFDRAKVEAGRLQPLLADRAISQREYDDANAALRERRATVQMAEAKVREAELNLSYTRVDSPIAGIAGRSLRSEGSLVTVGADSSLLTTVVRTDPIWVRFSLSEPEFERLRAVTADGAGAVTLRLADGTPFATTGRLNFAGSTVDSGLGTVQLRAEFANPGLALLPGQFVRAFVDAGEQDGVLVPQSAVLRGDQGSFVWMIDADGKATQRPVLTSGWAGDAWVVSDGLEQGDRVIVDNLLKLRPGAPVTPRAAPPASGDATGQTPATRPAGSPDAA